MFHYPPDPLTARSSSRDTNEEPTSVEATSSSDTDDEATSTSEEDDALRANQGNPHRNGNGTRRKRSELTDDEDDDGTSSPDINGRDPIKWEPVWEPLLGLGSGALGGLLTPGSRTWHKRKFEVGIDDLSFLGWPVFVREDGTWQKRKHKREGRLRGTDNGEPITEPSSAESGEKESDQPAGEKVDKERKIAAEKTSRAATSSEMTMFNVVFVLKPPVLEHGLRVREMYDHVVKKFSRALKWEQARVDYIWTESQIISSVKEKHIKKRSPTTTLYTELLARSSLANAISSVYTSISTSRIASVTLTPTVSISLQIPPLTSTSVLPSTTDPPTQSGLWLTTANEPSRSASDVDASDPSNSSTSSSLHLAKHFALLLLDSPQKILKDVNTASGPIAGPLSAYISASTPTKSFFKISAASQISLGGHSAPRPPPCLLAARDRDPTPSSKGHLHRIAQCRYAEAQKCVQSIRSSIPNSSISTKDASSIERPTSTVGKSSTKRRSQGSLLSDSSVADAWRMGNAAEDLCIRASGSRCEKGGTGERPTREAGQEQHRSCG